MRSGGKVNERIHSRSGKTPRLEGYLRLIREHLQGGRPDDASTNMRKSIEYILSQYIRENPQYAAPDLFRQLENLSSILPRETVDTFHKIRLNGNTIGAHDNDQNGPAVRAAREQLPGR